MADWGEVQRGVASGFQIGQQAGGRFSGLQSALDAVLAQYKAKQEMEQKKQLLGYEGLLKGSSVMAKPGDEGAVNVPGIGLVKAGNQMPNLSEKDLENIPEGITMNYKTPYGTMSAKNPNAEIDKMDRMQQGITDRVMNSKPGSVDYETAKDLAFGKMTINQFNHFIGGLGQQSRFKGQAMFQLAKQINPGFNETMLENTQSGLKARINTLDRQAGLIDQISNRVDKFADIALQYSDKVSRGKYPILNKIGYLWETNVNQDPEVAPDVKAFIDSVKLLSIDWARATTNQTGGAAVTDAARKEFGELISATDSPETFKELINLAKKDTQASKQGYADAKNQAYQQYQLDYGDIGNVGGYKPIKPTDNLDEKYQRYLQLTGQQ